MRILFLTSPNERCGIREHGEMLQEAMAEVAPDVHFINLGPDPRVIPPAPTRGETIVHANFQQGTHGVYWNSATPAELQALGYRVVVSQHDTFEKLSIMLDRGFPDFRGADALVVHEPVEGLDGPNVSFIRQGVPNLPASVAGGVHHPSTLGHPVVGSAGFPFPWKGYDALCRAAASAAWGVLIIAPGATVEQADGWQHLCPDAEIIPQWLPRQEIIQRLSQCDATAWLYTSGNSGTSGAIRLGIAARRPLIAYRNRQFRDLGWEPGQEGAALLWATDESDVSVWLQSLIWDGKAPPPIPLYQISSPLAALATSKVADRDSWTNIAEKYKAIYEGVLR